MYCMNQVNVVIELRSDAVKTAFVILSVQIWSPNKPEKIHCLSVCLSVSVDVNDVAKHLPTRWIFSVHLMKFEWKLFRYSQRPVTDNRRRETCNVSIAHWRSSIPLSVKSSCAEIVMSFFRQFFRSSKLWVRPSISCHCHRYNLLDHKLHAVMVPLGNGLHRLPMMS